MWFDFPEKLIFDESYYRTARLNEAVRLIHAPNAQLPENKKGQT